MECDKKPEAYVNSSVLPFHIRKPLYDSGLDEWKIVVHIALHDDCCEKLDAVWELISGTRCWLENSRGPFLCPS
jgi:hypothetical protein